MNKLPAIDRYIARLIFFPMLGTLVLSSRLGRPSTTVPEEEPAH